MRNANGILILLALVIVALLGFIAGKVAEPPQAAPTYTPWPTYTSFPTMDNSPTITPTLWYTPAPETLYGYPTPEIAVRATCVPYMDCYQLTPNVQMQDFTFRELYVGKYVLRNWCNVDPGFYFLRPCAVTISSKGSKQIEIWGYPAEFGQETGADLTGHGIPDIVVINWSDGNCCVNATVYEAGDNLVKIMDVGSHWRGKFTDLNGDGTYEYIATYRIWSSFCNNCGVWPSIVYEYQPEIGYIPATYKFKDALSADIKGSLDYLDQFIKPNMALHFYADEKHDYPMIVNAIYGLTAYYLLAGQQADAENMLNKYFPSDQAVEFMLAVQRDIQSLLPPEAK